MKFTLIILSLFIILCLTLYVAINNNIVNVKNKVNYKSSIEIPHKRKVVIDAFTYFQESIMLSIRLFRMNDFVDFFLIILSNTTHSGKALDISFSPFESFIDIYKHKIIFYNISFPSHCKYSWCRENYQRMVIPEAVKSLNVSDESVVIISDLDEIPTHKAMKYILSNPPKEFYMLHGYMYYYNYRNRFKESWPGVLAVKAKNCNKDIQKKRDERYTLMKINTIPIFPSLTHCSYCYSKISSIQKKLNSFAHTEFNKSPFTDRNYIINSIRNHQNIFDKKILDLVQYDENLLPLPNDNRFNYLKEEYGLT